MLDPRLPGIYTYSTVLRHLLPLILDRYSLFQRDTAVDLAEAIQVQYSLF